MNPYVPQAIGKDLQHNLWKLSPNYQLYLNSSSPGLKYALLPVASHDRAWQTTVIRIIVNRGIKSKLSRRVIHSKKEKKQQDQETKAQKREDGNKKVLEKRKKKRTKSLSRARGLITKPRKKALKPSLRKVVIVNKNEILIQ